MKVLGLNALILSGSSLVGQVITAITYLYVARSLGPGDFGLVSSGISVALLLLTALDFGINSLTIRELARTPADINLFTSTLAAKLVTSGGVGILWMLVTLGLSLKNPVWLAITPLGAYITLSDVASTLTVVPRSKQQWHVVAYVDLVQKVTFLSVALIVVFTQVNDRYALPFGLVAGGASSAIVSQSFINSEYVSLSRTSLGSIVHFWKASAGFGLSGLTAQLQRFDVPLVAAVAGAAAAGMYAAPARITNMLGVLPNALSAALFPRVAGATDARTSRHEALKVIALTTLVSGFAMGVIFISAEWLVPLVLGRDYVESVPVLKVILVGMVFACANGPLAALIQAEGRELYVAKVVGAASVLGLLGVGVGAHVHGSTGAAFGFVILQLAVLLPLLIIVWRGYHPKSLLRLV